MFEVNGLVIQADGMEILTEMKSQLDANGIQLFHTIKQGVNNIQFSCPIHKGGQERKPSCGMSTVVTYRGGKAFPAGTVHCFTCGYTSNLTEFVSTCFGHQDGGMFGNRWLRKNFMTHAVQNRAPINLNLGRVNDVNKTVNKLIIPESVLDSYRFYHDYMYKRKLNDEIIELFDVGYDKKNKCLTFPVKDLEGDVVFVQTRSVYTKFHHYSEGVNKTDYVYGAYEVLKYYPNATKVVITESILNCLTLWVYGIPAVALMGVGGGNQYSILKKLPYRSYVCGMDPDEAGKQAIQKLKRHLGRTKILFEYKYPDDRDINDLGEEVLQLEEKLL